MCWGEEFVNCIVDECVVKSHEKSDDEDENHPYDQNVSGKIVQRAKENHDCWEIDHR